MHITEFFRSQYKDGASLPQILLERAVRSKEAMIFLDRDGVEDRLSYAELLQRAWRLSCRLKQHGMTAGCPVILAIDDEKSLVLSIWAAFLGGAVAIPLTPPASYSINDEALKKIIAVVQQCKHDVQQQPGQGPEPQAEQAIMLLSDLNLAAFARHSEWQGAISSHDCFDVQTLLAQCDQDREHESAPMTPPSVTHFPPADALAMLMFSSGSTGDPKGVQLTHRQLIANLIQLCERSELDAADRSLSWLPLTHDMGLVLFHLCHTLAGLAQYKMTPLSFARNPAALLQYTSRYRITLLGMPNFGFDQVLRVATNQPEQSWDLSSVKLIYNGAEPIDPALCRRFIEYFQTYGLSPHVISPAWGIAEAAVAASGFYTSQLKQYPTIPSLWISQAHGLHVGQAIRLAKPADHAALEVCALGAPMTGMEIRALDDDGNVLAESCLGHLEIKGPNVCKGYFGKAQHDWCPSGDIGFLHQGVVYLTGRAKDVIFLNGRNVYSNDIETALCSKLGLAANTAAVVGLNDPHTRKEHLYVFFRHERDTDREAMAWQLRTELERQLSYPVRAAIGIAALPRTTSGKIRRFALRQALLDGEFSIIEGDQNLPQREANALESSVIEILASILSHKHQHALTPIDLDTPLSHYGLDSLGFMQLCQHIEVKLGPQINPADLIRASTVGAIAQLVQVQMTQAQFDSSPAQSHDQRIDGSLARRRIEGQRVPLTARQQMLWTAWLLEPEGCAYHETYWLEIRGSFDSARWTNAARSIIAQHSMLSARIDDRADLALIVDGAIQAEVLLHATPHASWEGQIAQQNQRPFDLTKGPLIRLHCYSDGDHHTMWVSAHHIITDGWSLHTLINQIFEIYQGRSVSARQQQLWYDEAEFKPEILDEWRQRIQQAQAVLLPGHQARLHQGSTQSITHRLSPSVSQAIAVWRRQHGSEFSLMLSAVLLLSSRLAQVSTPCIATVANGRQHTEQMDMHGYFALSLPCAITLNAGATMRDLVAACENYRLELITNQVPDLGVLAHTKDASLGDKIQLVYVHQNTPEIVPPEGLQLAHHGRHRGSARTSICISSYWQGERLCLDWDVDAELYSCAQIQSYAELLEHVVSQILAAPETSLDNIDLLSSSQRSLYRPYLQTKKKINFSESVIARFESAVHLHPQLPALNDSHETFTYQELAMQVDHVCLQIERSGIARGERVLIATRRSVDYVIGLLACLKMACVAVPIDPALPLQRLQQIAQDSAAALLLSSHGLSWDSELLRDLPLICIERADSSVISQKGHAGRAAHDSEAAYIIYTSGSTGTPKGVLNSHHSLINMIDWVIDSFEYRIGETICQFAPFSFDVSLAEILPSLCAGLYLHILPDEKRASPLLYLESMRQQRINIATLTPAYLAVLNEHQDECAASLDALRLMILGGEALKSSEVQAFRQHSPHVQIINVYGPTETTVLSSFYAVPHNLAHETRSIQPLGQPIANTEFWVLDEAQRVCPATVPGTLYIGGDGLSIGYWNDEEKTKQAFHLLAPDGGKHSRFYCSGDLVRLALDGQLEFIGRADTQIKLRGFRIELSEISAVLEQHPLIQTAVVTAQVRSRNNTHGDSRRSSEVNQADGERVLVAYYSGQEMSPAELQQFVAQHLPAHMRPSLYMYVTQWPLTSNRKIDLKSLPAPQWHSETRHATVVDQLPQSPLEADLISLWQGVLGIDHISRSDNFALLGGSSLSAAQLIHRIRQHFGRDLALIEVLRYPQLSEMALRIQAAPMVVSQGPQRADWSHQTSTPASEAQARMLFLEQSHPGTPLNNIPLTLKLQNLHRLQDSDLQTIMREQLQAALRSLEQAHPILKTSLQISDMGVIQVFSAEQNLLLQHFEADDDAQALSYLRDFHAQAFDLQHGPLWRVALVQGKDQQQWLALCLHHAIADGVSLVRLLEDLSSRYQQTKVMTSHSESEAFSYQDYVAWQTQLLNSDYARQAQQFWSAKAHQSPCLNLPQAASKHSHKTVSGRQFTVDLDAAQSTKLQQLCLQYQTSPFALMISLFGYVLGQACDSQRFALGVTFSGRSQHCFENVLGLFVNTLPLVFEWSNKDELSVLFERTKFNIAALQAMQDYPLNRAMAAMELRENAFNVLFNEELLPPSLEFAGRPAALEGIDIGIAKFPLLISFLFGGEAWRWRVEVRESECCPEWVQELMDNMLSLIDQIELNTSIRLEDLQMLDPELMAMLTPN